MLVYRGGRLASKCLRELAPDYLLKNLKRGPKFTTETRATRIRLTPPGTELPQEKKDLSLSGGFTVEHLTRKAH